MALASLYIFNIIDSALKERLNPTLIFYKSSALYSLMNFIFSFKITFDCIANLNHVMPKKLSRLQVLKYCFTYPMNI